MPTSARTAVIGELCRIVTSVAVDHPTRVCVDGISAAGKSTLVDELKESVGATSRHVTRVSLDGFHQPRAHRYRRGRRSPVGYYEDAFDVGAFVAHVLRPLGPGGSCRIRRRVHDLVADEPVDEPVEALPVDTVVLVDGSFLQRPEFASLWDFRIFVDTDPAVARARSVVRDAELLGGERQAAELFDVRYAPAFRLYAELADPVRTADVVMDNDDVDRPRLRWALGGPGSRRPQ